MRVPAIFLCTAIAACASTGSKDTPPDLEPADLILVHGQAHIGTRTATPTQVAIRGGVIQALGPDLQAYVGPGTRLIDLQGSTVVPGLVDAAVDLLALGRRRTAVDLVGTASPEEAVERVRSALGTGDGWVYGRGWDRRDWRPSQYPDRTLLDGLGSRTPIALESIDGDALWVNSAALTAAGIDARTQPPPGGRILKDRRRRPTGVLLGTATELVLERMPPPLGDALVRVLGEAERACAAAGLVEVHVLGASAATLEALRRMDRQGSLRLRVRAHHDGRALALSELLEEGPFSGRRLAIDGVHFPLDGALHERQAKLRQGYADRDAMPTPWRMELELVRARAASATERGFALSFTAHGDLALSAALDVLERLPQPAAPRIHGVRLAQADDLGRVVEQNARISVVPSRTVREFRDLSDWLGEVRAERVDAWKTWRTRGATLALASDAPEEDPAAALTLLAATTRQNLFGEPAGGFVPSERLSRSEALDVYSAHPLRPGRPADLTVFDRDVLEVDDVRLATALVRLTLVDGEVAFAKPGADRPPPGMKTFTSTASASRHVPPKYLVKL